MGMSGSGKGGGGGPVWKVSLKKRPKERQTKEQQAHQKETKRASPPRPHGDAVAHDRDALDDATVFEIGQQLRLGGRKVHLGMRGEKNSVVS